MTYTQEDRKQLTTYLANHELSQGMGDEESACTVAAINLAISGELTDDIPDCMSNVLGDTVIRLQDAMPADLRNSERYKRLIPNMPGTGREQEKERLQVLLDWMWNTVLPLLQPEADEKGFGSEWCTMCRERTAAASYAAAGAASSYASYAAAAAYAADAADAAYVAAAAADAAAAAYVAATAYAADAAGGDDSWTKVDVIGMLERMTYLEDAA